MYCGPFFCPELGHISCMSILREVVEISVSFFKYSAVLLLQCLPCHLVFMYLSCRGWNDVITESLNDACGTVLCF